MSTRTVASGGAVTFPTIWQALNKAGQHGQGKPFTGRTTIRRTSLPYRSGPLDVATGLPTRLGEQEAAARLGLPPKRWASRQGGRAEGLAGAAEAVRMTAGIRGQGGAWETGWGQLDARKTTAALGRAVVVAC